MAGYPTEKNSTFIWYFFILDADGDPVTGAADLDVEFSVDGGTFADVAGTEVDEGEGLYSCPISAAEMNGDTIALICKTSTAGAKTATEVFYTSTRQIDGLAYPTTSGRSIDVATTGEVGLDLDNTRGTINAAQLATGVVTAAKLADDSITSSVIADDAVTAAKLATDAITAAKIAAGAIGSSEAPNLDAAVSTRATPSQVNSEVLDVLTVDTHPEVGQESPSATQSFLKMVQFLFKAWRNKSTQTATEYKLFGDNGTTVDQKATVSEDGVTATRDEISSGP